ncbi:WGxxGxxG family protein [Paenibacillus sp. MBLB4367]|uniref:WGxxGxxG family protein n=1 Tax=Paenibacillus sp. MBLB4367 TaxID=3384767 RepID=UPI00390835B9
MKKLSSVMMSIVLILFLSLPAYAEGTSTATGMNNTTTNTTGNTNAYGTDHGNTTRAYATNDNRNNWGWLGLLGLFGLAGLRNRSREHGK